MTFPFDFSIFLVHFSVIDIPSGAEEQPPLSYLGDAWHPSYLLFSKRLTTRDKHNFLLKIGLDQLQVFKIMPAFLWI